jgi:GDP-mannose 6-dehydrogenase
MKIAIFGLGYVGAVTAGCLSGIGHSIVGVDVHPQKVETLDAGESPIIEPSLNELLKNAKREGRLRATIDAAEAVLATDVSLVCVGTPSAISGSLDLRFVRQVTAQIAEALRKTKKAHVLIFRSTMLPGSTQQMVDEFLGDLVDSGRLQVIYFPEFLREGCAVDDFQDPALTVVGTRDGKTPAELMGLFAANATVVNWNTAELVKYACNAFHATKVAFANEIGRFGKQMQIDTAAVMSLLCQDKRLNISSYYLRPGNPFGGSCLPKDVRALIQAARSEGVSLPVIENLLPSNEQHARSLLHLIEKTGKTEVVILGLSFKPNTDDLRESCMVEVAQTLLGRGYKVRIYDPQLNLAQLVGTNKRLIDTKMPHLASLLHSDLAMAIGAEGLVVVSQRCAPLPDLAKCVTPKHSILDVNGWPELKGLPTSYEGFCW